MKAEGQPLPKRSRVKLCGTEGQSDADWVRTLKDAVVKTEANLQMPPGVREQIVTALNAEISRLKNGGAAALPPPRQTARTSALDGLSALPPLPEPKPEVAGVLPPPRMIAPKSSSRDYAALPPMPTTVTAPTRVLTGGVGASLPALPKPRMQFICFTPGETGDVPCAGFTRDTLLTVRAGEDLPPGTSLRFVRDGDSRADVVLAHCARARASAWLYRRRCAATSSAEASRSASFAAFRPRVPWARKSAATDPTSCAASQAGAARGTGQSVDAPLRSS